jgi:hypothetical protein
MWGCTATGCMLGSSCYRLICHCPPWDENEMDMMAHPSRGILTIFLFICHTLFRLFLLCTPERRKKKFDGHVDISPDHRWAAHLQSLTTLWRRARARKIYKNHLSPKNKRWRTPTREIFLDFLEIIFYTLLAATAVVLREFTICGFLLGSRNSPRGHVKMK